MHVVAVRAPDAAGAHVTVTGPWACGHCTEFGRLRWGLGGRVAVGGLLRGDLSGLGASLPAS